MPNSFLEKLKKGTDIEEVEEPTEPKTPKRITKKTGWLGELAGRPAVDIYQTEDDLVIQSAIAGVKKEDLEITVKDELITIKGERPNPLEEKRDYFAKECYWGPFLKEIIPPAEIDSKSAEISFKEGILVIRIPKIKKGE